MNNKVRVQLIWFLDKILHGLNNTPISILEFRIRDSVKLAD